MHWDPLIKEICKKLKTEKMPKGIQTEEHFERCFVEPIVRGCIESRPSYEDLEIATHPWVKPDTPKPYSEELRCKIKRWKDCKKWANVEAWGMRHTLDMFVRDTSAVIAVFGFKGDASDGQDDNEMTAFLNGIGVWPVVLRVP